MSKHLPRFYTNTYCLWIDEGTAGRGEEEEDDDGRPVERMRKGMAGEKKREGNNG